MKPLPAVTDRRHRPAASDSPEVRSVARLSHSPRRSAKAIHAARLRKHGDDPALVQAPADDAAPDADGGYERDDQASRPLDAEKSLVAAASVVEDDDAGNGVDDSFGAGNLPDILSRAPTHEEVKEFCLLSGGGYGEIDHKVGKFYIGAYLEPLQDEGASEGERERGGIDPAAAHDGGKSKQANKLRKVSPAPLTRGKHDSAKFGERLASSKFSDRLCIPRERFQEGKLPHHMSFRSFAGFKGAESLEQLRRQPETERATNRGLPSEGARVERDDDMEQARLGSFVFNLRRSAGDARQAGAAGEGEAVAHVSLTVTLKPPAGAPPFEDAELYVSSDGQGDEDAPVYCCWQMPAQGQGAPVANPHQFMPSTASELVGRVATPALSPAAEELASFPWKWKKIMSSASQNHQHTLAGITIAPQSACAIQIPLLLQSKRGLGRAPTLAHRLSALSRLHAWGLLHTLELSVTEGQQIGEEKSFELHRHRWQMLAPTCEGASLRSAASGGFRIEGLGEMPSPYFKERIIDRDMAFLRALDPSLSSATSGTWL